MRQGQQNRRGRGRNNRKGQNPLTRSFESNGPDMKIRGTPAHIAEKYISLARDALSSSDPVLAENYLQHAEHYNRIIMTFREQQAQPGVDGANGANQRNRSPQNGVGDIGEIANEDEQGDYDADEQTQETSTTRGPSQNGRSNSGERGSRSRSEGGQREKRARSQGSSRQNGRQGGRDQDQETGSSRRGGGGDRDAFGSDDAQPEFLKRPVRRPRRNNDAATEDGEPTPGEVVAVEESQD